MSSCLERHWKTNGHCNCYLWLRWNLLVMERNAKFLPCKMIPTIALALWSEKPQKIQGQETSGTTYSFRAGAKNGLRITEPSISGDLVLYSNCRLGAWILHTVPPCDGELTGWPVRLRVADCWKVLPNFELKSEGEEVGPSLPRKRCCLKCPSLGQPCLLLPKSQGDGGYLKL